MKVEEIHELTHDEIEKLRRARSEPESAGDAFVGSAQIVDIVRFVVQMPGKEGFRSHRRFVGPLLTHFRYFSFRLIRWLVPPLHNSILALTYEIAALRADVARIQKDLESQKKKDLSH